MSFQLTCMCRILCAVLTARGSDITKTTVLKTPDLYVKTVERMVMHITPVNVKIPPNAQFVVRAIRQNQTLVKSG